jgi:glycosyltransferase involved in cell wall biosynthesis
VDHERFTPSESSSGSDKAILEASGVPVDRPLVAFVGTLEPRKGVASLVAAFDRVADAQRDAMLVLCGQSGWGMRETEGAIMDARHGDRIVRVGYLPDAAVPALLRQASVVAYPALEEGFGLPALEAMACGALVITTEGTAMAEVAQGAAHLVRPGDTTALAEVLELTLAAGEDAPDARRRQSLGVTIAQRFTWSASVSRHVEAYEMARGASQ